MLIFTEGGKPENPEKNPHGKGENMNTSNKLNSQYLETCCTDYCQGCTLWHWVLLHEAVSGFVQYKQ
jgi:hypothetical protein